MSALTSLFNFLYVYLRFFVSLIFGGLFDCRHFLLAEQREIASQIVYQVSDGHYLNGIYLPGSPIVALILGIFVVGGIIGLIHRLMK